MTETISHFYQNITCTTWVRHDSSSYSKEPVICTSNIQQHVMQVKNKIIAVVAPCVKSCQNLHYFVALYRVICFVLGLLVKVWYTSIIYMFRYKNKLRGFELVSFDLSDVLLVTLITTLF